MEIKDYQWQIQDFPERGNNQTGGVPTYHLAKVCRKLHENERTGGARPYLPLDPPLIMLFVSTVKLVKCYDTGWKLLHYT